MTKSIIAYVLHVFLNFDFWVPDFKVLNSNLDSAHRNIFQGTNVEVILSFFNFSEHFQPDF